MALSRNGRLLSRLWFRSFASCQHLMSSSSTSHERVQVKVDDKSGVATMKLNSPPVNSLSLELLTDMSIALDKLHNEKGCRALILTSAKDGIFSAGLDIMEMYNPKDERIREFWRTLQEVWKMLYGSPLATIAAINGIVAPFWFQDTMINTIGHRETERALQLGILYSGQQALKVGLIDDLVAPDKVMETAEQRVQSWLKIPDFARQITKEQLRSPIIQKLIHRQDEDINNFVSFITKGAIQKSLEMYLNMLKQKQKK